ncbi:MAG TPA: hypothetical protein ENJ82_14280 [Bacteroidetes bacterium]|nr:hypothetical protein [Bacteroidota bacterium]
MKDRVVVRILQRLPSTEFKGFRAFLNCSVFNRDEKLIVLLDRLECEVIGSRKRRIPPEAMLSTLWPTPKRLNAALSALYGMLNLYLATVAHQQDSVAHYAWLFKAYESLDVDLTIWEKEYKRATKTLDKSPDSSENLLLRFQLEHTLASRAIHVARKKDGHFIDRNQELLDEYYLVTKLKYLCASHNLARVYRREPPKANLAAVQLMCEEMELSPLGKAFSLTLELLRLKTEDLALCEHLLSLLEKYGEQFSEEDCNDLYGYLLNAAIPKMSLGEASFEKLVMRIYDRVLDKGLLLDKGRLSPFHFRNMVSAYARWGKLERSRAVIDKFSTHLTNDFGGVIVKFAEATWSFYSGHLRTSAQLFREVLQDGPEDVFWAMDARQSLWKAYFGLYDELSTDEHEEMLRLYDSFRVYIMRNNAVADATKKNYLNFIRIFNRLLSWLDKAKQNRSPNELHLLLEEVASLDHVTNRHWLTTAIQDFLPQNPDH